MHEQSLDPGDVLDRWTGGAPALHLTVAAEQLLEHLAALEGTAPADQPKVLGLGLAIFRARALSEGAAALAVARINLMSGIEMDESR